MLAAQVFAVLLWSLLGLAFLSASQETSKGFSLVPMDSMNLCFLCHSHLLRNDLYREDCDIGYHVRCLQDSFANKMTETEQVCGCQNIQDSRISANYYIFLSHIIFAALELPDGIVYIPGILEPKRLSALWAKSISQPTTNSLIRALNIGFPIAWMVDSCEPIDLLTITAAKATPENLIFLLDGNFLPSFTLMILLEGLAIALRFSKFANASVILNRGANINALHGKENRTSLSIAILREKLDTVKFLIDNNADLNLADPKDVSPLFLAVKMNNGPIIELLMQSRRVNLSTLDRNKLNVAQIAVCSDKLNALTALVDNRGAMEFYSTEGFSLLQYAAMSGSLEAMKLLIDRDFKFMTNTSLISYGLHIAIMFGKDLLKKLKFLLEYGADPYEPMIPVVLRTARVTYPAYADKLVASDPPIVIAVLNGHFAEFELILAAGMNPNSRIFGDTCALLHLVCEVGNVPMAIHLVSLGADTHVRDSTGRTPFECSSQEFANQVFNN